MSFCITRVKILLAIFTVIFVPAISWFTAGNMQTGYGQGQVEASATNTQSALLMPGNSYTLLVWRALAGSTSDPELIARMSLVIETIPV